ncbi:MAG: hypothetical protein IPO08_18520 [Xanthomonadales bacterium]|nr:hypothetical protein [Xanthomonadales bacterium]
MEIKCMWLFGDVLVDVTLTASEEVSHTEAARITEKIFLTTPDIIRLD